MRQRQPAIAADIGTLTEEAARVVGFELLQHRLGRRVHLSVQLRLLRRMHVSPPVGLDSRRKDDLGTAGNLHVSFGT